MKKNPQNKKSLNLGQDFQRIGERNQGEISERENHKKLKLKLKLTKSMIQNL